MLILGPDVSLKGSHTVSPTTAALCVVEPLPHRFHASMYFLALSQAHPLLAIDIASITHDTSAHANSHHKACIPNSNPTTIGAAIAITPGAIISFKAHAVAMSTHFLLSALALPVIKPLISLNCLLTSSIIWKAALHTAFIVIEQNKKGSIHHKNNPMIT